MFKVLFVCTHNRCRSILAEALTSYYADDIFDARSAGSQPAGVVYQGTIDFLQSQGISTDGLVSESWDSHESFAPDVVITVCDSAAGETCPLWMGNSLKVHWGLKDPSKLSLHEQSAVFDEVAATIKQRIDFVREKITSSCSAIDLQQLLIQSLEHE